MFDVKNGKVIILPDILSIPAFKALYERDTSQDKERAMTEFAFMYHMHNRHSPFWRFKDKEKIKRVKQSLFPKNTTWQWTKDKTWQDALKQYLILLEAGPKQYMLTKVKESVFKMADSLKDDEVGTKDMLAVMNSIEEIFDKFDKFKEAADREEFEAGISKIKGNLTLGKRQI